MVQLIEEFFLDVIGTDLVCFSDAVEIVKNTDLKNYLDTYRNSIVYEMLESQVERITGERMYSEYSSFRIQYLRWKTKKRSPK